MNGKIFAAQPYLFVVLSCYNVPVLSYTFVHLFTPIRLTLIKPLALISLHSIIHTLHSPIYYLLIGLSHIHINTAPYIRLSYSTRPQQSFLSFLIKMNKKNVFAKSMRCITIIIISKVDKFNEITICYFGQQRITRSIWVAHFTTIRHHVVHFPTPRAHIWTKNLKRNKLLPVSHETNLNNKLTILINAWNLPQELEIRKNILPHQEL